VRTPPELEGGVPFEGAVGGGDEGAEGGGEGAPEGCGVSREGGAREVGRPLLGDPHGAPAPLALPARSRASTPPSTPSAAWPAPPARAARCS